ncbi:MAG: hypothetical protein C0506_02765 [Anaerolinea sp.]|nr:hypothetical protein [Anaerolinea sp.]
MTTVVNPQEARTRLPELLELVEAGDEVVIERDGKPVAKLVKMPALDEPAGMGGSILGILKGEIWYADDIDGPLDEEDAKLWYESKLFPEPDSGR